MTLTFGPILRSAATDPGKAHLICSYQRGVSWLFVEVRFAADEAASLREWTARQVANALPFSACQACVLLAAFVDDD